MVKDKIIFDKFIKYKIKKKNTIIVLVNKQKKEEILKLKLSRCFNYRKTDFQRVDYWALKVKAMRKGLQKHKKSKKKKKKKVVSKRKEKEKKLMLQHNKIKLEIVFHTKNLSIILFNA
jgi:hypothetical protein